TSVFATTIDFRGAGYDQPRMKNTQEELIDRLQAVSGVQSAAFARLVPFTYGVFSSAPVAGGGYETGPDGRAPGGCALGGAGVPGDERDSGARGARIRARG